MTRTDVTPELEAVARAIYEADHRDHIRVDAVNFLQWKALRNAGRHATYDHYIDLARAALLAIREPTEAMMDAALGDTAGYGATSAPASRHRAVIDYITGGEK